MKCRICDNKKNNKVYNVREMLLGYKEMFPYFQCSKCNCLQIQDLPENLEKYYPNNYYSYQSDTKKKSLKSFLIHLINKYAVFNKGAIGSFLYDRYPNVALRALSPLSPKKDMQILDVGCGAGKLLFALRKLGFKNILGVDPFNENEIEYENGLKIQKKNIHEVQGKWDVVMLHHSFEHVQNPVNTLLTAFDLLKTGGVCIIRIPIISSYAWKKYGINWVQLDAPRHFFLHSIESMKILSNKTGFDLYNIVYDSSALQFWGSEQYLKDIPLVDECSYGVTPKNSIFSKEEIDGFKKHAKKLNEAKQGDQAAFYLRKS